MVAQNEGRSPAFQLYPSDFLADENVAIMSLQERGAYITLICFCWREGSIPDDVLKLSKMCGVDPAKFKKLWLNVKPCFTSDESLEGRLTHPRLEKERQKQTDHKVKCSDSGKKGAQKRWGNDGDRHSDPIATPSKNNGEATETPMAKNSSSSSISSSSLIKENPPTPQGGEAVLLKEEKTKFKETHVVLAKIMAIKIKEVVPLAKIPENFDRWAHTLRLIEEIDKIPLRDVQDVFIWANKDTFWGKNILCPEALRRQIGRLHAKMVEDRDKAEGTQRDNRPYAVKLLDSPRIKHRYNDASYPIDAITVDPTCKRYGDKGSITVKATGEEMAAEDWVGVG